MEWNRKISAVHTPISLDRGWSIRILAVSLFFLHLVLPRDAAAATESASAPASMAPTEHVILFFREGFGQDSLKGGTMPTLSRLVKEGAGSWSAPAVRPAGRVPTKGAFISGIAGG